MKTACGSSGKRSSGRCCQCTRFSSVDVSHRHRQRHAVRPGRFGVWSRNGNTAYRVGRALEAGRVWTNCYHQYPAHAAFGGYKASGFGRENHRMMLDHYQQAKNLLVSYDEHALGLF
ncbi:aldehyde dehydrogenase family protein [Caulobacter segnis]